MKTAITAACMLLGVGALFGAGPVPISRAAATTMIITKDQLPAIRASINKQGLEEARKSAAQYAESTAAAVDAAAKLQEKVNALNAEIAGLNATKQQLEKDAAALKAETAKVSAENAELAKQKAQLVLDAADLVAKKTALDGVVKQAQQERDALAARNVELQTKYETLQHDVRDTIAIQDNLKSNVASLTSQITVLQEQKATAVATAAEAGSKLVTAIAGMIATVITAAGGILAFYVKFRKSQIELKAAEAELARQGGRSSNRKPRNA